MNINHLEPINSPAAKRAIPWGLARINWFPQFVARRVFGKPLAPTSGEWSRINAALYHGDPAMDKVVDWMFAAGPGPSKKLFDQALEQGIGSLNNPPRVLVEFFAGIDQVPAWLDKDLLHAAIEPSHLYGEASFYVLRDMALMGGYAYFNSMNQTLANAGSLYKETSLRIGETGKWLVDITEPGGLERFGAGFISTIKVRMIHALVRRHLQTKPDWDSSRWGIPINQIDMLATYLAFGPVNLSGIRLLGAPVTRKESRAIMHMWRYVGWLMGLDEQWLAITEGDGLRKLYHTFLTHRFPDEKIRLLGEALKNEPLSRPVPGCEGRPKLTRFLQYYTYHKHLSNSALILGFKKRRQLGLPLFIFPWYPALSAPFRFVMLGYSRMQGGDRFERHLAKRRTMQKAQLDLYFGEREQGLLKPGKQHPAHVPR